MFNLTGKTAFVTGASRGLGMGIAKCLAEAGADIMVSYVKSKEEAERVAEEIRAMGRRAVVAQGDVGNEADVIRLFEAIEAAFGRLDILVNNAGINSNLDIDTIDLAEWERVLKTNITGCFLCSKYALPMMRRQKWGRIIQISSLVAEQGALFGQVHYASTKGAQLAFTKTLARSVALDGITVNSIAPGVHMTEQLAGILLADPKRMDITLERTPMHRIGTLEDIGYAAVFLASEEANFITGATIDVNGGAYMR